MDNTTKQILVIDDDPDIGVMIKLMLEFKGYSVKITDRGKNIAGMLRDNTIDLIIMDMLLSGINGVDICRQLKQSAETACIPLIMISAHPNAKEICLEAGADEFISKPFDMQDILTKIDRLIQMGKQVNK